MALHSFLLPPSTSFLRNVAINFIPWNFQFAFPSFFDFLFLPRIGPALSFDEIRFVDSITGLTSLDLDAKRRRRTLSCLLSWINVSKLIKKDAGRMILRRKGNSSIKKNKKIPTIQTYFIHSVLEIQVFLLRSKNNPYSYTPPPLTRFVHRSNN